MDLAWIYLAIFLAIPLARIIPRIMRRRQAASMDGRAMTQDGPDIRSGQAEGGRAGPGPEQAIAAPSPDSKPRTKADLVLGKLNGGTNAFEDIQKSLGIDPGELESVLQGLEKDGMIKVVQKQGVLGVKIRIYPTDRGFKEYYS